MIMNGIFEESIQYNMKLMTLKVLFDVVLNCIRKYIIFRPSDRYEIIIDWIYPIKCDSIRYKFFKETLRKWNQNQMTLISFLPFECEELVTELVHHLFVTSHESKIPFTRHQIQNQYDTLIHHSKRHTNHMILRW